MSRGKLARMSHFTIADYVRLEASTPIKHEYIRGEIRVMPGQMGEPVHAMGGGTIAHARIAMAIGSMLRQQLRGRRCAVYSCDARVRVRAADSITYPDLSVCCGSVEPDEDDQFAIANPTVIIEITSPSTEAYNRGTKLDNYKLLPSVRDIVLVGHREHLIEVHHREEDGGWTVVNARAGERASISSIGCELDVDEAYEDPFASS